MDMDRRSFLKGVGGIAAAAGLGALGSAFVVHKAGATEEHEAAAPAALSSAVRWGMVIDTRMFKSDEDFDRCVSACHSAHNVPHFGNVKDEIKWIWKAAYHEAFPTLAPQYLNEELEKSGVLIMCNHCEHPPCVRVCPTKATFKAPNGITMMDYHRCIGCRFCMAACPFGSRSFNWRDPRPFIKTEINPLYPTRERGVVEKCNFCEERLTRGPVPQPGQDLPEEQKPLCVLNSNGAITFGNLKDPDSGVRKLLMEHHTIVRKAELGTNPAIFYIV